MDNFFVYFIWGCSSLSSKEVVNSVEREDCDLMETPAQFRLLTSHEYNSSIYDLFYGEGDTCWIAK